MTPDDPVRAQYEQWVYPPPVSDLSAPGYKGLSDPEFLGAAYWPDRPARADLHILVAGCGPNVAARLAFQNRNARVIGIDISSSSLAHAARLKASYQLDNLTLHRGELENAAEIGETFDWIHCAGVLHHLRDPVAGLKALTRTLRADGVVYLMLYGKYGRAGVYLVQEICRRLGLGQSGDDVEFVKRLVGSLPPDHPVGRFRDADDMQYGAGVVDLFLHPQDQAYSVPDCLQLVAAAGLTFQGWEESAYYYPELFISPQHPLYERLGSLPDSEIWPLMELFQGTLAKHSFFACRQDRDPESYRIDFSGERFMGFVPVPRLGLALERQADGSATMARPHIPGKLNVTGANATMAQLIDGRRTVRDICRQALPGEPTDRAVPLCRELFRLLWRIGYCHLVRASAVS